MERSLTNHEVNALQERVREELVAQLGVHLR
jgi:phenylalanyl-tRNA synthetase beta subunit